MDEQRQQYQDRVESELNRWAAAIGEFVGKAEKAGADAKVRFRQQIDELQAKQAAARQKLQELKAAGEDAWTELRPGIEKAWEDLRTALERAAAKFK